MINEFRIVCFLVSQFVVHSSPVEQTNILNSQVLQDKPKKILLNKIFSETIDLLI